MYAEKSKELATATASASSVIATFSAFSDTVKLELQESQGDDAFPAIAASGGLTVVGVPTAVTGDYACGSAYVFSYEGVQLKKLDLPFPFPDAQFGVAVAVDSKWIVVGAAKYNEKGAAFVFNTAFEETAILSAEDGDHGDFFGCAVDVDKEVIVVGAKHSITGTAYVFDTSDFEQVHRLEALDSATNDKFGSAVAVEDKVIVVGAHLKDSNRGSAYIFDAESGSQTNQIVASDRATGDRFGRGVALDKDVIVVGAKNDVENGISSGSAYIFDISGGFIAKVLPSDGGVDKQRFGFAVAVGNDYVAVGAPNKWNDASATGSAYIFDKTGGHIAKVLPRDGSTGHDRFGLGVAVSDDIGYIAVGGDTDAAYVAWSTPTYSHLSGFGSGFGKAVATDSGVVVVGAPEDGNGGNAYMFSPSGTQLGIFAASDDAAAGDNFGVSVAVDDGLVVIGAKAKNNLRGSAYVYDVSGHVSGQVFDHLVILPADDSGIVDGDYFGCSVAVDSDTIVVGAFGKNNFRGAARIYERSGQQLSDLSAEDGADDDCFGTAVAVGDGVVVVAADLKGDYQGGAYIFDVAGNPLADPLTGEANDHFGSDVAVDDGVVVVGAVGQDGWTGRAYIYSTSGEQIAELEAEDGLQNDCFGISVAVSVSDGVVVVGAKRTDNSQGSFYLFDPTTGRQIGKHSAPDASDGDKFGVAVAVGDGIIVSGFDDATGSALIVDNVL